MPEVKQQRQRAASPKAMSGHMTSSYGDIQSLSSKVLSMDEKISAILSKLDTLMACSRCLQSQSSDQQTKLTDNVHGGQHGGSHDFRGPSANGPGTGKVDDVDTSKFSPDARSIATGFQTIEGDLAIMKEYLAQVAQRCTVASSATQKLQGQLSWLSQGVETLKASTTAPPVSKEQHGESPRARGGHGHPHDDVSRSSSLQHSNQKSVSSNNKMDKHKNITNGRPRDDVSRSSSPQRSNQKPVVSHYKTDKHKDITNGRSHDEVSRSSSPQRSNQKSANSHSKTDIHKYSANASLHVDAPARTDPFDRAADSSSDEESEAPNATRRGPQHGTSHKGMQEKTSSSLARSRPSSAPTHRQAESSASRGDWQVGSPYLDMPKNMSRSTDAQSTGSGVSAPSSPNKHQGKQKTKQEFLSPLHQIHFHVKRVRNSPFACPHSPRGSSTPPCWRPSGSRRHR
eukprot:TRINITY_DN48910_c0_g1_i1.p1 TRINITY_DN48910_c0_g1~~TRINITY_DN48910_c0_g1_i1.p1  ORF type:complete len:456 (-),score=40.22 TRINITY_DN48910_c0_g1_i1:350-1717(-)